MHHCSGKYHIMSFFSQNGANIDFNPYDTLGKLVSNPASHYYQFVDEKTNVLANIIPAIAFIVNLWYTTLNNTVICCVHLMAVLVSCKIRYIIIPT